MIVGTTQAASLLDISCQRLRQLLKQGRVRGAEKVGRSWQIPQSPPLRAGTYLVCPESKRLL